MKKIIIIFLFLIMITLISCNNERRYQITVRNVTNLNDDSCVRSIIYIFDKDTGECNIYLNVVEGILLYEYGVYDLKTIPPELKEE